MITVLPYRYLSVQDQYFSTNNTYAKDQKCFVSCHAHANDINDTARSVEITIHVVSFSKL